MNKFILLGLMYFISCGPKASCPDELYYRIPTTITPAKLEYSIGDTIWVETSFPVLLKDDAHGVTNNFSGYDFGGIERYFEKLDTEALYNGVASEFHYQQLLGQTEIHPWSHGEYHVIRFEEKNDSLYYKAGIIPQKSGIFITFLSTLLLPSEMSYLHNCNRSNVNIKSKVNNEGENGFLLLVFNQDTLDKYDKFSRAAFDSIGGFVFRVK